MHRVLRLALQPLFLQINTAVHSSDELSTALGENCLFAPSSTLSPPSPLLRVAIFTPPLCLCMAKGTLAGECAGLEGQREGKRILCWCVSPVWLPFSPLTFFGHSHQPSQQVQTSSRSYYFSAGVVLLSGPFAQQVPINI